MSYSYSSSSNLKPNPRQILIPQLDTISASDLLNQKIEPISFTIDTILPTGLFLLSGSSKIGKSFLCLDMSNSISRGSNFWNYQTTQGDVLYFALEDNHRRLQERLNKITSNCDFNSEFDIHFVTTTKKLGEGLTEQIKHFLKDHPKTRMIVIDTLQYIRNNGNTTGTYSGDYRDMDMLREIITGYNLTMLLITHNHKSDEVDPVNRVYGSAGLTGAVDGIFVLEKKKRNSDKAKLTIANRDTESFQFELRFDRSTCRWIFISNENNDSDEDDYLYELLNLLLDETPAWYGTATELCAALTCLDHEFVISPITISKILKSRQDYLQTQYNIECKFSRNKTARIIELSRDVIVVDYKEPVTKSNTVPLPLMIKTENEGRSA
jgi:hypothetical protein